MGQGHFYENAVGVFRRGWAARPWPPGIVQARSSILVPVDVCARTARLECGCSRSISIKGSVESTMIFFLGRRAIRVATLLVVAGCALLRLLVYDPASVLTRTAHNREGQCWSGMGNKTALQRLTGMQAEYDLEELVEGPGLYDIRETRAACKFQVDDRSPHFPHAMQQLYRCFSYWTAASEDARFPKRRRYLIMFRQPITTEFFKGMIQQLRQTFGVRVVNFRNDLKVVRPNNISYEFDSRHSFAMRGPRDARALRDGIWGAFNIPQSTSCAGHQGLDPSFSSTTSNRTTTTVRIGVLDRKKTRRLKNLGAIVRAIEREMQAEPRIRAKFVTSDFEDRTFLEQVQFLSSVDVLVSPHGAQLTGIPFLPDCSRVLELFPAGYVIPQYFASLAAVAGVGHSYMYLGGPDPAREAKVAMKTLDARNAARAANLCPHADSLARAVVELTREWRSCCDRQAARDPAYV